MIKILFLSANPIGLDQLQLDEEVRSIDSALRQADLRDKFELIPHLAVRASDLQDLMLRHRPDIVHFSGHGTTDSQIVLKNDAGEIHLVSGQALRQLFAIFKETTRCVVLNACYSESQAAAISEEVAYVVGMAQSVHDETARRFSPAFYRGLGYGEDIPSAFQLGKNEIDLLGLADGHIPQLKTRQSSASAIPHVDPGFPQSLREPDSAVDGSLLHSLSVPGGAVRLQDRFYIERSEDADLRYQLTRFGTTTTIRAPRQTGKTSLLVRGLHAARQNDAHAVLLDLQGIDLTANSSQTTFLHEIAEIISLETRVDEEKLEDSWRTSLGPQKKLTYFLEDHVLPERTTPLILAIDEADRLLMTTFHKDFFGLLRSWHNLRAFKPVWENLNIVLVISTEPYLLIEDNQSPFNVGLQIDLHDFTVEQTQELNARHGSPLAQREVVEMTDLLGGHPFLTRQVLYTMVVRHLSWREISPTLATDDGPLQHHLMDLYRKLAGQPELIEAMKQIIRFGHSTDGISLFRLLKAGLIKGKGDAYASRCDLYDRYLRSKLL